MSSTGKTNGSGNMSVLPFDPADLMKLRSTQADLARMMGVSRQSVCQWVKEGKISTYPDGTIDPQRATKDYLANTDPLRARATVMRTITSELDDLKTINVDLAASLAAATQRLEQTEHQLQTVSREYLEHVAWLNKFLDLMLKNSGELRGAVGVEAAELLIEDYFDQAGAYAMGLELSELAEHADPEIAPLLRLSGSEP